MKTIDLRGKDGGVSPKYLNVPQPMYVFHSKQELKDHIIKNELKTFHIIKDVKDFLAFVDLYKLQGRNKYSQVSQVNVFFATNEKFIPDSVTSKGKEQGVIRWRLDKEGQCIPTDNCFIQLHLLFSARNHYLCFFSNGVEMLSLSKWGLTAAIKDQFLRPTATYDVFGGRRTYETKLNEILQRKKVNVRDVRLFHLLFNPLSDVYLNVDEAVQRIYGGTIRKADREKLIQTERFRKLFKKELGTLMGDLKKAFQEEIPDKKMVEMAKEIFDKSIEKGSVDDSLKVYEAILNIREDDEVGPAFDEPKLIEKGDGTEKKEIEGNTFQKKEDKPTVQIELLDEETTSTTVPEKETEEHNEFTVQKPVYDLNEEDKAEKEEQLKALRVDTDAIDFDGMSKLSDLDDDKAQEPEVLKKKSALDEL